MADSLTSNPQSFLAEKIGDKLYFPASEFERLLGQRDAEVFHHGHTQHDLREALAEIERLTRENEELRSAGAGELEDNMRLKLLNERLRALLQMAEDCLPDGDYQIRAMAAKEIREALRPADETFPCRHLCGLVGGHCSDCGATCTCRFREPPAKHPSNTDPACPIHGTSEKTSEGTAESEEAPHR